MAFRSAAGALAARWPFIQGRAFDGPGTSVAEGSGRVLSLENAQELLLCALSHAICVPQLALVAGAGGAVTM